MDDIEAIKQVQGTYGRAVDTGQWDLLRTTVTDDFSVDTGAQGKGATDGLEAFIARVKTNPSITVHHAILPEITLTSDTTADGIWAAHLFAKLPDGTAIDSYGHYYNTYEKVGDAWKIKSLLLVWLHREVRPGEPLAATSA
jgi:hypothetical protein